MASPFSTTLRSLKAEDTRSWALTLGAVSVLVAAWLGWLFLSRIPVLAVSTEAHLEAVLNPRPVEPAVDGRVVAVHAQLDQAVEAGDVLVELDPREGRHDLEEEKALQEGLVLGVEAMAAEIAAEETALEDIRASFAAALEEARARHGEAEARAELAETEAERLRSLAEGGVVSVLEGRRAEAESLSRRAAANALEVARSRLMWQQRTESNERRARLQRLQQEHAELVAELGQSRAQIALIEHRLEQHKVRAPITGRVGRVGELQPGAMVQRGDSIATIVPRGRFKVVAGFQPAEAVGRIRPGQRATVRFQGFPWTQYGSLTARVARVASESEGGRIRVELEPSSQPGAETAIPLQQGLPGGVEVEVERLSPATLVLRAAGRWVSPSPPPDPAGRR